MTFALNPPAEAAIVALLQEEFPNLPAAYFAFLARSDGGEGFVTLGEEYYFQLFLAAEVSRFTREYELSMYLPGYVAVGSNGGGELFVFAASGWPPGLFMVPAIGMEASSLRLVSRSFQDVVEAIERGARV